LITFTNPRFYAEFADWPLSAGKRGRCTFRVETSERGARVLRTTTGKAKTTTYCQRAVIVDGSDGKVYILELAPRAGHITIRAGTLFNASPADIGRPATVHVSSEPEAYGELVALINSAYGEK
jgi:hypothetical protein